MSIVNTRIPPSGVVLPRLVQIPSEGSPARFLNEKGEFVIPPGGGAEPAGPDDAIQFNGGGGALGGTAEATLDASGNMALGGALRVRDNVLNFTASKQLEAADLFSTLFFSGNEELTYEIIGDGDIDDGSWIQFFRSGAGVLNIFGATLSPQDNVNVDRYDFVRVTKMDGSWWVTGAWSVGAAIPYPEFITQWLDAIRQTVPVSSEIQDQSGNNNDALEFDAAGVTYQNNVYYLNAFNSGILSQLLAPTASFSVMMRLRRETVGDWAAQNNVFFGSQNNNTNLILRLNGADFELTQGGDVFATGSALPAIAQYGYLDVGYSYDAPTTTGKLSINGVEVFSDNTVQPIGGDNFAWGVHGFNNGWFQGIQQATLWLDVALTLEEQAQMIATWNRELSQQAIFIQVEGDSNTAVVGSWGQEELVTQLNALGAFEKVGTNFATGGSTWDTAEARRATVEAAAVGGGRNVWLGMLGTNDLNADGLTAAQALDRAADYLLAIRAGNKFQFVAVMQIPALLTGLQGADQVSAYNDGLLELGFDLVITQDIVMADASDLVYFDVDGIHLFTATTRTPIAANVANQLLTGLGLV